LTSCVCSERPAGSPRSGVLLLSARRLPKRIVGDGLLQGQNCGVPRPDRAGPLTQDPSSRAAHAPAPARSADHRRLCGARSVELPWSQGSTRWTIPRVDVAFRPAVPHQVGGLALNSVNCSSSGLPIRQDATETCWRPRRGRSRSLQLGFADGYCCSRKRTLDDVLPTTRSRERSRKTSAHVLATAAAWSAEVPTATACRSGARAVSSARRDTKMRDSSSAEAERIAGIKCPALDQATPSFGDHGVRLEDLLVGLDRECRRSQLRWYGWRTITSVADDSYLGGTKTRTVSAAMRHPARQYRQ